MNLLKLSARCTLLAVLALSLAGPALAQGDQRGGRPDGGDRADRSDRGQRSDRADRNERNERADRGNRNQDRGRPGPRDDSWWDGAHGHNHRYTPPGRVVVLPPRAPAPVWWGGVGYRYWDGVWATSGPRGWVTVRPPLGIWVHDLPGWRTALVIGGLAYFYANGVYYRERSEGGYEVVPPPVAQPDAAPPDRSFVYPRQGQNAQQQAGDEYECHRWAVTQSGFDPTGAATGQATVSTTGRGDYQRARAACLEGRGYTVR